MTMFFPLNQELTVRFVKLMVREVWGFRGGLHYFSENISPTEGASYTGQECDFVLKSLIFNFSLLLQFVTLTSVYGDIIATPSFPS